MLTLLLKVFRALNSEAGPWQIAFATGLALIIGLTPVLSLHNLLILLFVFIFRVNLATFFAFWAIFSGFAYLLDPWFDSLGQQWLMAPGLLELWTGLYQSDFWQLTRLQPHRHPGQPGGIAAAVRAGGADLPLRRGRLPRQGDADAGAHQDRSGGQGQQTL